MKNFTKIFALGAALVAAAPFASATPISGQITITGNDTINTAANTINFQAGSGQVGQVPAASPTYSSTLSPYFTTNNAVGLIASLNYTPGTYTGTNPVFTVSENGETLDYFLQTITASGINAFNQLQVAGTGYFTELGAVNYTSSSATFSLNSQQGNNPLISFSDTSFAVPTAVTPEPNSLILLGTGLVSAAGMMIRRRRIV